MRKAHRGSGGAVVGSSPTAPQRAGRRSAELEVFNFKLCFIMAKKEFTVKAKFVFEGEFYIKAESKEQAKEYVMKHCGLVLGGDIHTSLPDDVCDWDFCVHPQKVVR